MRHRAGKIRHHAALPIVVRNDFDAGLFAHPGLGAVRAYHQLRAQRYAAIKHNFRIVCVLQQRVAGDRAIALYMRGVIEALP